MTLHQKISKIILHLYTFKTPIVINNFYVLIFLIFVYVLPFTFAVNDVVVRAAFFKGTEYKDLHVNLGSWGTRAGTGDQDPVPDWSILSRAQIWASPLHEEKRKKTGNETNKGEHC